jgi:hypothetical protein
VSLIWALVGNCGNQFLDDKRESQGAETLRERVSMQENWDGATRSSEEASVMDVERRGCVRLLDWIFNWRTLQEEI